MQRSWDSLFPLCKENNETNLHFIGKCFATINVSSILQFHSWKLEFKSTNQLNYHRAAQ